MNKVLIYGYGNPGRQDDGLGVLLVEKIEQWKNQQKLKNVFTDSNYQLNIEDAYNLHQFQSVIFIDASKEEIDNYLFTKIISTARPEFSMHSVLPGFVTGLCKTIHNSCPDAYLMHIKGYQWEFMEELSAGARKNLDLAFTFLVHKILEMIH
jgi:hydrogenase maturation protease